MKKYLSLILLCTIFSLFSMESNSKKVKTLLTVESIINNFNQAIENENSNEAQRWYDIFSLLAGADWKSFNEQMRNSCGDLDFDMMQKSKKIDSTQRRPGEIRSIDEVFQSIEQTVAMKKERAEWLIEQINQNNLAINWQETLGDHTNVSNEQRITYLKEVGRLKKQD